MVNFGPKRHRFSYAQFLLLLPLVLQTHLQGRERRQNARIPIMLKHED
jgi:hypothetical protein